MYRYQCSRPECGTNWILQEGNLNGFVLTCPICGKGRGLFAAQEKRPIERPYGVGAEELIISVSVNSVKTVEEFSIKIEEFVNKYSLNIIEKDIQSTGKEIVCKLLYKNKGQG